VKRYVTVFIGLARTNTLTLVVRDQGGHVIGRRSPAVRGDGRFDYHLRVRPRIGVTSRTRWRLVATATGPLGQVTRKSVTFSPLLK
jgi:hypothetical protein